MKSAISFVQSRGAEAVGLHGHSLGSLICLKCFSPTIIHGNDPGDWEERELLERSRRGMKFLSSDSRLEIVEGANHGLREQYEKVVELAKSWYQRYVPVRRPDCLVNNEYRTIGY